MSLTTGTSTTAKRLSVGSASLGLRPSVSSRSTRRRASLSTTRASALQQLQQRYTRRRRGRADEAPDFDEFVDPEELDTHLFRHISWTPEDGDDSESDVAAPPAKTGAPGFKRRSSSRRSSVNTASDVALHLMSMCAVVAMTRCVFGTADFNHFRWAAAVVCLVPHTHDAAAVRTHRRGSSHV
jgi:hypothetical protein